MTESLSEKNRLVKNNVKFFILIIQNFNLSKISNRYLATYVWTTNYAHSHTMPFPPGPTRINKRFSPQGEFLFRKKKNQPPTHCSQLLFLPEKGKQKMHHKHTRIILSRPPQTSNLPPSQDTHHHYHQLFRQVARPTPLFFRGFLPHVV